MKQSNSINGLTALAVSLLTALAVYGDNSAYIAKVWDYCPAPSQFVHEYPEYEAGDTQETMRRKAEEQIAGNAQGMISLGAWGGYVVFSFDHPVVNVPGEADFIVEGNSFYADQTTGAAGGGSSEPGIVMVSRDDNGNGLPDDAWYELAGSEYSNPQTLHNYSVTYERPAADHEPTPDPKLKYRIDTTFVKWTDNQNDTGYLVQIKSHKHAYYPEWIAADRLTFTGSRLPDNYEWTGSQYLLYAYDYGYADNHPNDVNQAAQDIAWAVKADGSPKKLNEIHFVKVYTALHQQCGMLGDTSTEVTGARDLHPNATTGMPVCSEPQRATKQMRNGQLLIIRNNQIFNPIGILINNN